MISKTMNQLFLNYIYIFKNYKKFNKSQNYLKVKRTMEIKKNTLILFWFNLLSQELNNCIVQVLIFDLIGIFSEKINNITDIVQILNQNTIIKSYALFSDIQKITKILKQEAQKDSIYINSNLVPNKLTHFLSSISLKEEIK